MREIKFRAWTGKKMFYQGDQYLGSFIRRAVAEINLDHDTEPREHESYLPNGGDIEEYLMQYTGLKDKNGAEIYEGDVVECDGHLYKIAWNAGKAGFWPNTLFANDEGSYHHSSGAPVRDFNFLWMGKSRATGFYSHGDRPRDIEVIGNIYENPELLEAKPNDH